MFTALYLKEWRDKAFLFLFELAILALLLLGQLVFSAKPDLREWLIYAVFLLFYPFAALILGAAGFEAEYRQGAWAYLFSRPVPKSTVWLAKFGALLSMLAVLWLVFLGFWLALPGIREIAVGARAIVGLGVESGFPFWSLWLSVFLLTVAFSLSPLHDRQFNVLFLALFVGLGLTAAIWILMISKAGGFMAWLAPTKVLPMFVLSQALIGAAFAAASVLTLVRSDFSQPRKLTLHFARWLMPFLVLALAGAAGWLLLAPAPGDRYLSFAGALGGEPAFITDRGVFRYSAAANRIHWLAKMKQVSLFVATASRTKVAYTAFDIRNRRDITEELWVADASGRNRRRILGRGPRESEWPRDEPIGDLLMSPDGAKIAILSASAYGRPRPGQRAPLWIINADGTGFENLPGEAALFDPPSGRCRFYLSAWAKGGGALVLMRQTLEHPAAFSLWLYDLGDRTARLLVDNAMAFSWTSPVAPDGHFLAFRREVGPEDPWTLALLDLETLTATDLLKSEEGPVRFNSSLAWDQDGDHLAYVAQRMEAGGPGAFILAVYSLSAHKTVADRVIATDERSGLLARPSWALEGERIVVLARDIHGLKIFDRDLREVEQVSFPRWLANPVGLQVVGDRALIEDDKTDSLWSYDLRTRRWKKLY